MKSFSDLGNYVSSELVANLDILVCTVALMGLDVGATLGELLVGGCTLDCGSVDWAQARLCLFSVAQALVGEWFAEVRRC